MQDRTKINTHHCRMIWIDLLARLLGKRQPGEAEEHRHPPGSAYKTDTASQAVQATLHILRVSKYVSKYPKEINFCGINSCGNNFCEIANNSTQFFNF